MTDASSRTCIAFVGDQAIASGLLAEVVAAIMARENSGLRESVLVFDDLSGEVIDLDLRGTVAEAVGRLETVQQTQPKGAPVTSKPRGRGRPRLGVVPREVTLLPRQWDWLAAQPGSVSQVLRKLVDDARRADNGHAQRAARERTYRFLAAKAGDLPGYEEAIRALFAGDGTGFGERMESWPPDVRNYALRLAGA